MTPQEVKQVSKRLSYVLRHRPDSIGIELGRAGWIDVDILLSALARNGRAVSRETLDLVVANNDKQRFEFDTTGQMIRARQGHSLDIDLEYEPAIPPDVLFHGTAKHNLDSIFKKGLIKGRRHHVHMSTNKQTMVAVGMRHGKPVVLAVDAASMHQTGHQFFVTGNAVWLTEHVPAEYLTIADI